MIWTAGPRSVRSLEDLVHDSHGHKISALTVEALDPAPGRRIPPHPMADGEAIADLPLRLEAVPGAVRMLCPAERAT